MLRFVSGWRTVTDSTFTTEVSLTISQLTKYSNRDSIDCKVYKAGTRDWGTGNASVRMV